MQNQIGFDRSPDDLILDPFAGQGLAALCPPEFLWRTIPRTEIMGFAASEHAAINAKIENFLSFTSRFNSFPQAVEFSTFPVLLENAAFKQSFVTANDRCLLSGAAGVRLLNNYRWQSRAANRDGDQALSAYFTRLQNAPGERRLPVLAAPPYPGTPFAIECRNTVNFYHFVTESLSQLCLVEETGLTGPIFLHYPNSDDKTRGFTHAFIAALFPELIDRVRFERAPVHYPSVVVPYNFASSFYQQSAAEADLLALQAPTNTSWRGRLYSSGSRRVLHMNALDSSLLKLRARALAAIAGKDFPHLPRRFWVGRDVGHSRPRRMTGEEEIIDKLSPFGFERVFFEHLPPLEQIAIMARAEVMISQHGAAFTNMLFASPAAHVIEIGTLQTAKHRWGDFWRIANTAQCHYTTFFADFNAADPLTEPSFAKDGIVPVHLSQAGLGQVMSFIADALGGRPRQSRLAGNR